MLAVQLVAAPALPAARSWFALHQQLLADFREVLSDYRRLLGEQSSGMAVRCLELRQHAAVERWRLMSPIPLAAELAQLVLVERP